MQLCKTISLSFFNKNIFKQFQAHFLTLPCTEPIRRLGRVTAPEGGAYIPIAAAGADHYHLLPVTGVPAPGPSKLWSSGDRYKHQCDQGH